MQVTSLGWKEVQFSPMQVSCWTGETLREVVRRLEWRVKLVRELTVTGGD